MESSGSTGGRSAEVLGVFERIGDRGTPLTAADVTDELDCTPETARRKLRELVDRGALASRAVGDSQVWWRPSPAAAGESGGTARDGEGTTGASDLSRVVRRTIGDVVRAESRPLLEQHVCDSLVEIDAYLFAVSGEFSSSYEEFSRRASAGVGEEYLDVILHPNAGPPLDESLGAQAARSGAVAVNQDVDEADYEFWRDAADEQGFRSYAAVPYVYEDRVYGVLGVYADRPGAFGAEERSLLSDLGELVGCAINGLVREEVREHAIELEFRSETIARPFIEASGGNVEITVDSILPLHDETELQYWTVTGIDPEDCIDVVLDVASAENAEFLSRTGDAFRLQVHGTPNSASAVLRRHDGRVKSITIDESALTVVAELPTAADVTAIAAAVREAYPSLELVSERSVLTATWLRDCIDEQLTERQSTALRAAYSAGYFEQPRHCTGDDIAERLGVTRQTFNRHLRKAESRVFGLVFDEIADSRD